MTRRAALLCTAAVAVLTGFAPAAVAGGGTGAKAAIDPARLRHGDVILRRSNGYWSVLFARLNPRDARYSHAGIVVHAGSDWRVVHAEADDFGRDGRVRVDDWSQFTHGAEALAVLRVADRKLGSRVAAAALDMAADRLAFDFGFELANSGPVYCTEFVWRALQAALGRDPLPEKARLNGREAVLIESFLYDMPDLVPVAAATGAVKGRHQ